MTLDLLDVRSLAERCAAAGAVVLLVDVDASGTREEVEAAFSSLPREVVDDLLDGQAPFAFAMDDAAAGRAALGRLVADLAASGAYGRGSFDLLEPSRTTSFDLEDLEILVHEADSLLLVA